MFNWRMSCLSNWFYCAVLNPWSREGLPGVERRLVQVNLSPALLRDIGLEGYQGQIALVREREYQTGFRLGNRIT